MKNTDGLTLREFFERLAEPAVLAQLLALVIAGAVAVLAYGVIRRWHRDRYETRAVVGFSTRIMQGLVVVSPFLILLVLVFGVRFGFDAADMDSSLLAIAQQLVIALILVRLGVFALRQLLGENSWLKGWQNQLTAVIWIGVSFELLGWFDAVEKGLDAIDLLPGKQVFTIWELVKSIVYITIILIATTLIARAIEGRVMKMSGLAMSTRIGVSKFAYFILIGLGLLLGINAAGIDFTALTVLTGAIGLGLGFGLQAIASNFVSGFVLLMDKSIKPGDVISFTGHTGTSTDNFGWVQELRGRYIVVRDRDGVETLVPNQHVITNSVINWSYSDARVRLRLPVMLSYQDDPEIALKILLSAAADHPRILKEPGPVTRLMSFEDYGMRLEVRFWIADPMNGVNNVRSDVNRTIFRLFREAGLTIPVAQREIRIADSRLAPPRNP